MFDKLAKQQQWSNRETSRGMKGRYKVDQLSLLQAKVEALQLQMEKQKGAIKAVQVQVCALCGEESHHYEQCQLCQPEEGEGQINSINNEPSYFPKPPFPNTYSNNQNRFNNNFSQPQRYPNQANQFQPNQGGGNRNFYSNNHFQNQHRNNNNNIYRPPHF